MPRTKPNYLQKIKEIYLNWLKEKDPNLKLNFRTQIFNLHYKLTNDEKKNLQILQIKHNPYEVRQL